MAIFKIDSDRLDYEFDYNAVETNQLRSRSYENVSIDDLRRIALWKLDRVVEVPEALLQKLRALSVADQLTARSEQAKEALNALVACDGIGYPMASAFLKFIRPDVFPIIDVRAYRALTGKRLRTHHYNTDLYLNYVDQIREISNRRNFSFNQVDEQLYCFDKDRNGPIDG